MVYFLRYSFAASIPLSTFAIKKNSNEHYYHRSNIGNRQSLV